MSENAQPNVGIVRLIDAASSQVELVSMYRAVSDRPFYQSYVQSWAKGGRSVAPRYIPGLLDVAEQLGVDVSVRDLNPDVAAVLDRFVNMSAA